MQTVFILLIALSALMALFTGLLIYDEQKKKGNCRTLFKSLATAMFLGMGIALLLLVRQKGLGWLAAGLLASAFGDEFLAFFDRCKKSVYFVLGVSAFGAAQICYSIFFTGLAGGWTILAFAGAAIITLLSCGGILAFKMNLKSCLVPVVLYSYLLSLAFMNATVYAVVSGFAAGPLVLSLGMASFLISDVILLFKYFYPGARSALTGYNLSSYYLAQALLCFGAAMLGVR